MSEQNLRNVDQHIDNLEQEAIDLMKAIIPIKALGPLNDGDGEHDKADFLKKYLQKNGLTQIEEYPSEDDQARDGYRPNLILKIPGQDTSRTVWFLTHMDVVPEGDRSKWDTEPFEAVVKEGRIYGRGTEDNNQSMVSAMMAAKALTDLDITPHYNVGIALVADEETGSTYGLQYLVDHHADLFNEKDIIIVPDAGEPDSTMIEVAEKSIIWVKFNVQGKQVHASTPDKGINAFRAGARLAVAVDELHEIYDARDEVFDVPYSTFEPTKKEANVPNVNTIPGEDIFYLDCRILPQYSIEDVMQNIRRMCDTIENDFNVKVEISTEQEEQAAPATPHDAPVVKALQKAIKEVYQIDAKAMGIGGGTVAAIFRRAGYPAAVWSTIDDLAHQPNEYCIIKNLINDAKVFAHVAMNAL
ncbi:MAG: M20 family metallo-hydrolase [Caldithrix sp.]|nr:M20 family metallo-hydrolase [Caldithrix sp.]